MLLSAAPCHNVMSILNHLALLQPGFTAALALLKQALCRDKSALMMKSMVVPKKGRGRQVLKRPKCKNPPKQKAEKVKYVRIAQNSAQNKRMDQTKWRRSLPELLAATDLGIIRLLQKDKILPEWAGHKCPRCSKGTLSPLLPRPGRTTYAYRCGAKGCQCYVNPQHLHPLFVEYSGGQEGQGHSLQTQAGLLLLTLNNINHASIHRLLHINHKAIEDFNRRLHHVRQKYVETHEKKIIFGADANWVDVEADEATFDRCDMSSVDPTKVKGKSCILWEQWCGLVERGRPETLVLHRLKPNLTPKRAPGPGPIRKIEWRPLAKKHLEHRKIIFHTDSARSYKLKLEDVYHDHVVHQKKRVKVKGKWTWRLPTYVKTVVHELPDGQKLHVKAGTQVIDRCWRYLKDRIVINQYSRAGSSALRAKLRSAQWCYWHRNDDLWLQTGVMCTWAMSPFLA